MADTNKFSAKYQNKDGKLEVKLNVFIWNDESVFYAYSPALDLTGYGKTENEAKRSFETTLQEFVKYTTNKKTLFDELEHLGWTVNRKKKRMHVPDLEDLLKDNETFREIYKREDVKVIKRDVELALA